MDDLKLIFEPDIVKSITVYVLMLSELCLLVKYALYKEDIENKWVQKFIWWILVFVVAIISGDSWVMWASLFIWWLIIASEEFMQKLAIILRSNSKDIWNNLVVLAEKANENEIQDKLNNEIQEELKENKVLWQAMTPKKNETKQKVYSGNASLKNYLNVEKLVKNYLDKNNNFLSEVKVTTNNWRYIFDWALKSDDWSISAWVEIKYLNKKIDWLYELKMASKDIIYKLNNINLSDNTQLFIIFVSENINKEVNWSVLDKTIKEELGNINIWLFELKKDLTLEKIYIPEKMLKYL